MTSIKIDKYFLGGKKMLFFKQRRELIQEVKWYRNLYADALKEIEDLGTSLAKKKYKLRQFAKNSVS